MRLIAFAVMYKSEKGGSAWLSPFLWSDMIMMNLENCRMLVPQTELFVTVRILLLNWCGWHRHGSIIEFSAI